MPTAKYKKTIVQILKIYFLITLFVYLNIFSTAKAHTKHHNIEEEINPKKNIK